MEVVSELHPKKKRKALSMFRSERQKTVNKMILEEALKVHPRSELVRMKEAGEAKAEEERQMSEKKGPIWESFLEKSQRTQAGRKVWEKATEKHLKDKNLPGKDRKKLLDEKIRKKKVQKDIGTREV